MKISGKWIAKAVEGIDKGQTLLHVIGLQIDLPQICARRQIGETKIGRYGDARENDIEGSIVLYGYCPEIAEITCATIKVIDEKIITEVIGEV